jgi:hypothetical protein
VLRALPLVAIVLAAPLCGGEDRVAILEREKAKFLTETVEKKEFWAQVERKGAAAKEHRKLEEELAAAKGDLAVHESRRAGVAPQAADAAAINGRAAAVKAEIDAREQALDESIRALEEKLAGWRRANTPEGPG